MRGQGRILFVAVLIACGFASVARAERAFREQADVGFTLCYEGDVPIATFSGSPEEVGRQHAQLLGAQWQPLRDFAFGFLGFDNSDFRWNVLLGASNSLISHATKSQQREIDAMCKAAGDDGDVVRVMNCLPELRRFGCSTLIVESSRSATGGPLLGRNLDFPTLGILEKYGLVMVYHVEGKRPFVSIALPGVVGVLSGINDAGLAVATLDSYQAADGSAGYEPAGVPVGFVFRQLLEECETVDQAEALLKSTRATTWMNLAVCDRERGAVFEITPKQVVRRVAEDAILPCTNHFRTPELAVNTVCSRYEALSQAALAPKLDVEMICQRLDAANQGAMTFQTMVFEPRELKLYLSMGKVPSSSGPLQMLNLDELLTAGAR